MSRIKLLTLSLFLISFVSFAFGSISYAQIGPGGDKPGAGPNMPQNSPDKPGAGGNVPTDGPKSGIISDSPDEPSGGLLTLTPLAPVKPGILIYEVFNATPGGPIYIFTGLEPGGGEDIKVCPMTFIDIFNFALEDVLVADDFGYAAGIIDVPDVKPGLFKALYMQALDVKDCEKSNLTAYPLPQNNKF